MQTPIVRIWLAWQDNLPVGCIAAVTYSPSYAFIGLFVVKPEHRGQGIGRRLWQHALKTLNSVECIGLEAADQMMGFYEKAGFQKDCVTTRRQMFCRSDQSQHPNTTLLHRSDITVVLLREISLEATQRYDERHEISPGPISLNCGYATGREMSLWQGIPRGMPRLRAHSALLAPHRSRLEGGALAGGRSGMASLLLNNAIDRHKGVVLIDTPGHNPSAKTIRRLRASSPRAHVRPDATRPRPQHFSLACLELG